MRSLETGKKRAKPRGLASADPCLASLRACWWPRPARPRLWISGKLDIQLCHPALPPISRGNSYNNKEKEEERSENEEKYCRDTLYVPVTSLSSLHYFTYCSKKWLIIWWLRQYRIRLQFRRPKFNPWFGKIPWRREWLPSPVFLGLPWWLRL